MGLKTTKTDLEKCIFFFMSFHIQLFSKTSAAVPTLFTLLEDSCLFLSNTFSAFWDNVKDHSDLSSNMWSAILSFVIFFFKTEPCNKTSSGAEQVIAGPILDWTGYVLVFFVVVSLTKWQQICNLGISQQPADLTGGLILIFSTRKMGKMSSC